jgi:CMP/dCMP kinase
MDTKEFCTPEHPLSDIASDTKTTQANVTTAALVHPKITVTGDIGSGKSIISTLLSERLAYKICSTGSIQRKIAEELGMSTLELNKFSETHPEIDAQIDSFSKSLAKSPESAIVDSRMAWFFLPESFKIYLQVDVDIAAARISLDSTRKSEVYSNIEETKSKIISRQNSETERFLDLYGVDVSDIRNYDLVLDTSYSSPEAIIEKIIECYNLWLSKIKLVRVWLSPKRLYPTQLITELACEAAREVNESVRSIGYIVQAPILVLKSGQHYYIYDGHKRTSAALFNEVELIPVLVLATEDEEIIPGLTANLYVRTNCKRSWVYDWEDCHKFRFAVYPDEIM